VSDRDTDGLRCLEAWHAPGVKVPEFKALTRKLIFTRGVGLPGRVWAAGRPAWISDAFHDDNMPRAPVAAREGLHGAFASPIRLGGELLGVIEFFSDKIRAPDNQLLDMMDHLGGQIGYFLERKRAHEAVRESEERLRLALEAGHMGTWEWEIRSGRVTWSPNLEALFGMKAGTFGNTLDAFLEAI